MALVWRRADSSGGQNVELRAGFAWWHLFGSWIALGIILGQLERFAIEFRKTTFGEQ